MALPAGRELTIACLVLCHLVSLDLPALLVSMCAPARVQKPSHSTTDGGSGSKICQSMAGEFVWLLAGMESAAGPCHTIISKAELTGRAAPSDLLGAPFNYITMAVMATVRCRPPGASQRFRAVLVRLRAALRAAGSVPQGGAPGSEAPERLGSGLAHRGGSLCASTEEIV